MQKAILIGLLFFSLQSRTQTVLVQPIQGTLNVGGGSAFINSAFTVDWSIGESASIETYHGQDPFPNMIVTANWNVTSGILQPFDSIHTIFNYFIPAWTNEEIRFYPVPTPNIVFINFRSVTTGKISIQLYSHEGKLLGIKEFTQLNATSTQSWDLSNRANGIYLIRIQLSSPDGTVLKDGTFKIEKNK